MIDADVIGALAAALWSAVIICPPGAFGSGKVAKYKQELLPKEMPQGPSHQLLDKVIDGKVKEGRAFYAPQEGTWSQCSGWESES